MIYIEYSYTAAYYSMHAQTNEGIKMVLITHMGPGVFISFE